MKLRTLKVSPLFCNSFVFKKEVKNIIVNAVSDVVLPSISVYALQDGEHKIKLNIGENSKEFVFEGKTHIIDYNSPLYVREGTQITLESSTDCFTRVVMFKPSEVEKEIYR